MKTKYLIICLLFTIFQFSGSLGKASSIDSIEPLFEVANSLVSHTIGERHERDYGTGNTGNNRYLDTSNGLLPNTFNMDAYNTVMNDNSGVWYLSDNYKEYKDIQDKRDKALLITGIATVVFKAGSALCGHIKHTREAEARYLEDKARFEEYEEFIEWYI